MMTTLPKEPARGSKFKLKNKKLHGETGCEETGTNSVSVCLQGQSTSMTFPLAAPGTKFKLKNAKFPKSPQEELVPMPAVLTKATSKEFSSDGEGLRFYSGSASPHISLLSLLGISDTVATRDRDLLAHIGPPPGLSTSQSLNTEVEHEAFVSPYPESLVDEAEPLPWDVDSGAVLGQSKLALASEKAQKASVSLWSRETSFEPPPERSPTSTIEDLSPMLPDLQKAEDDFGAPLEQDAENYYIPSNSLNGCEQAVDNLTRDDQIDPKLRLAADVAEAGGGLSGYTTVMMQQIPFKYTQSQLIEEINKAGFDGKYDFLYLPNQKKHGNRGFGFINFLCAEFAEEFYWKYHGQKFNNYDISSTLTLTPAGVQGFEQSATRFVSSWRVRKHKRQALPFFLKPVPIRLSFQ